MRIFVVVAAAFLGLAGGARAGETPAPALADVLTLLFRNHALDLGAAPSCRSAFVSSAGARTLGRYLAEHLAVLANPRDNRITLACMRQGEGWQCDLSFRHNDAARDILWGYGLRFAVDDRDGLLAESLVCTGTG